MNACERDAYLCCDCRIAAATAPVGWTTYGGYNYANVRAVRLAYLFNHATRGERDPGKSAELAVVVYCRVS